MDRIRIDRETTENWVAVAHSARMMRDVLGQIGEPIDGSAFGLIDLLYPFERGSDWCRSYLVAAIDHLEMWADYVAPLKLAEGAVVTHRFRPVQTLSRAALEASAQAVWVMSTSNAREATKRHLNLVLHDLDEQRKAAPTSSKDAVRDARALILTRLEGAVTEEEIGRFLGYGELVKRACAETIARGRAEPAIADPETVERLWRASAGSAHGRRWPSFALQVTVRGDQVAPGTYATYQLPDPDAITAILRAADSVMSYGVLRFADYCGYASQLGEILDTAKKNLDAVIPKIPSAEEGHRKPSAPERAHD